MNWCGKRAEIRPLLEWLELQYFQLQRRNGIIDGPLNRDRAFGENFRRPHQKKLIFTRHKEPLTPFFMDTAPGNNSEPHHLHFRFCHGRANIPWLETSPRLIGNLESLLRDAYGNLVDTVQAS